MGAGRGGQRGEQHQFVQIVFPYDVNLNSLFDSRASSTSFLDPAQTMIEVRWLERSARGSSVIDMTSLHRHASGVAILGGVSAVPVSPGSTTRAVIDPADPSLSNIPIGA
ncbi:MAG: hypothetical protein ACI9EF_001813 [Pseudohongiellaceae bacterium]|jgi:hypothetical protein